MSWFVNTEELHKQGARFLLMAMRNFPLTQTVLQSLDQGASIQEVGSSLNTQIDNVLSQHQKREGELESELAWQKSYAEGLQARVDQWVANPLQKQIAVATEALQEKSQQILDLSYSVTSLQEILERERRLHNQEVEQLKKQLAEQNRLIAKQHNQLEQLTGVATPE